jgi:hypothetical protein
VLTSIISMCLLYACRHNSDKSSKKLNLVDKKIWIGEWDRHKWQNGGTLTISKIVRDSLFFSLQVNGGGAIGEIEGKACIKNDSAIFTTDEDEHHCKMVFRINRNKLTIAIISTDCYQHAGLNADFDGNYFAQKDTVNGYQDTTETLISLGVLNRTEDSTFRKLVGDSYETYITDTQLIESDLEEEDNLHAKVIASSVNQMRTYMEYIIIIDSSKRMWTAVIDANKKVRYFTNSNNYTENLPKTIDSWRERFKEYPVIYRSKK